MEVDFIEVDIQMSSDEILFLRHNYTLPDGRWCHDLSWDDLSMIELDGHKLPKLEDVLNWAKEMDASLTLDLKGGFSMNNRFYTSVLDILEETKMVNNVLLLEWNHNALLEIKKRQPKILTRALLRG